MIAAMNAARIRKVHETLLVDHLQGFGRDRLPAETLCLHTVIDSFRYQFKISG